MNYLIGKDNFDDEFRFLLKENPRIAEVLPALIVRDGSNSKTYKILIDYKKKKLTYEDYDFSKKHITDEDIERYLTFVKETGLKQLISSKKIKKFVDYMIGVEAGLDSNGRKNRSGQAMEDIVEVFITDICKKNGLAFLKEANAEKIKAEWGYIVPVDKTSRRYDFVINSNKKLFVIETNFYGGEARNLNQRPANIENLYDILKGKYDFIWITDGFGWKSTNRPLRELFDHNDYLINLNMLENGILEYLL